MTNRWTWALLVLIGMLSAGTPARGADDPSAEDLYYKAWHAETADRDLEKAIALYQDILKNHTEDVSVVAKSQLQLGSCYEKLGQFDEAKTAYQKLIDSFDSQRELVEKAKARLQALDASKIAPAAKKTPPSPAPGDVDAAIAAKLRETKIDVDFSDTPPADIFDFLRDFSGLNIVIDTGHVDMAKAAQITFRLKDMKLDDVLSLICRQYQWVHLVHEGTVVITTPAGAEYMKACDAERKAAKDAGGHEGAAKSVREHIAAQRISINFSEAPLQDVLEFLREMGGFNIILTPDAAEAKAKAPVSLRVADLSFGHTLDLLCDTTGLAYEISPEGVIVIRKLATESGK